MPTLVNDVGLILIPALMLSLVVLLVRRFYVQGKERNGLLREIRDRDAGHAR